MINQICSQCNEITGPSSRCECCGGDPAAREVLCHTCNGSRRVAHFDGPGQWDQAWSDCRACDHSGLPGCVEAPYILEHDAHAKRAYWMDCPLSEIPLRAPFKELREVIPEYMLYVIEKVKHAKLSATCAACGCPGSQNRGLGGEIVCATCTWMDWGHHKALGVPKETASKVVRHDTEYRFNLWLTDPLVPAGLSAGGGA
jgi:hypothetical protein